MKRRKNTLESDCANGSASKAASLFANSVKITLSILCLAFSQMLIAGPPTVVNPLLEWNTFLGGAATGTSTSAKITLDTSGNIYVVGSSNASWGAPINDHSGNDMFDTYIAKYDEAGVQQWLTFIGGSSADVGPTSIDVDGSGNIYVSGQSSASWGTPLMAFVSFYRSGYIAKLNSAGALQWHTFISSAAPPNTSVDAIKVDASGNIYAAGRSGPWGTPVVAHSGSADGFAAKLNTNGAVIWNTFFGATSTITAAFGLEIDSTGNAFIAGHSNNTWGASPVNAHAAAGIKNAYVLKLDINGARQWHTFMGPTSGTALGIGVALDSTGNVYASGFSNTWGTPIVANSGNLDGFLSKLNATGTRQWHTFVGSGIDDSILGLSINPNDEIFMVGHGQITTALVPFRTFTGGFDVFVTRHDTDGVFEWFGYLGGTSNDFSASIDSDASGNIFASGSGINSWENPIVDHSSPGTAQDGFIVKLCQDCFLVQTAAPEEEGTFVPGSQVVHTGNTTDFEVQAKPGFAVETVSGCGGVWNDSSPYTTGSITSACTVEATFKPNQCDFYIIKDVNDNVFTICF